MAVPMLGYGRFVLPFLLRFGLASRTKNRNIYRLHESYDGFSLDHPQTRVPDRFNIQSNQHFIVRRGRTRDSVVFNPTRSRGRLYWSGPLGFKQREPKGVDPDEVHQSVRFDVRYPYVRVQKERHGRRYVEKHRVRQDTKVYGRYTAFLSLVNKTYGRYSEWNEVADAFSSTLGVGGTPLELAESLLINEFIDRIYGVRANFLKQELYSRRWYVLPIGVDALSNFWRHF